MVCCDITIATPRDDHSPFRIRCRSTYVPSPDSPPVRPKSLAAEGDSRSRISLLAESKTKLPKTFEGVRILSLHGLRDANEKVAISWFPECAPPSLVSSSMRDLSAFIDEHEQAVVKPLDRMAGRSVFMTRADDPNRNVILETLTNHGSQFVMVQEYISEARVGDKRILVINSVPVPYALLRTPPPDDFRCNLSTGATAQAVELTDRDRWICQQIGPRLRDNGLFFVGIDVIGDFMTEVNVTSPTGIRELDGLCDLNIGRDLIDAIAGVIA